ncbi:MAG TPA: tRNA guanosine(34) transglycosylase Tgt [Vicinamibacterales bacterium]|nr:tRNA guanosine(34) transglycosylase Tgt [Vicinamibacterales bacterium]
MAPALEFTVTHRSGHARAGVLRTAHGTVETPAFMPVGTRAAVKAVTQRDLVDLGAQIILANTYHLYLRPGDDLIARHGGLHRFMAWDRPILTDSGGYQVFSLADIRTVTDDDVRFRSHLDGSEHAISPEKATDVQARLGSDIAMVLDECLASPAAPGAARAAMERSARWARRARDRFVAIAAGESQGPCVTNPGQAQFGIVQGGVYPDLRAESVQRTTEVGFDGYAIGGLSVGEPVTVMYDVVEHTAPLLPPDRPRYLMGTGMPDDLVECVARGIDMFDCVLPTRNARNGQLLTREGRLVIKNARYAADERPPDEACGCYTCRTFSRAYLRHLFLSQEMTAATLNSLHNLYFYLDTMKRIREAITFGTFENLRQEFHRTFSRRSIAT